MSRQYEPDIWTEIELDFKRENLGCEKWEDAEWRVVLKEYTLRTEWRKEGMKGRKTLQKQFAIGTLRKCPAIPDGGERFSGLRPMNVCQHWRMDKHLTEACGLGGQHETALFPADLKMTLDDVKGLVTRRVRTKWLDQFGRIRNPMLYQFWMDDAVARSRTTGHADAPTA